MLDRPVAEVLCLAEGRHYLLDPGSACLVVAGQLQLPERREVYLRAPPHADLLGEAGLVERVRPVGLAARQDVEEQEEVPILHVAGATDLSIGGLRKRRRRRNTQHCIKVSRRVSRITVGFLSRRMSPPMNPKTPT